jgi:hypothetical protein
VSPRNKIFLTKNKNTTEASQQRTQHQIQNTVSTDKNNPEKEVSTANNTIEVKT